MDLYRLEFMGMLFVMTLGTFLHFVYEWSGENVIVGFIGTVRGSVWEHLKLLFWPAVFYMVIECFLIEGAPNFIAAKATALVAATLFIVVVFYTYTGIFGKNFFIADVILFYVSAWLFGKLSYTFISSEMVGVGNVLGLAVIAVMMLAFIMFTYSPPRLALFQG